MLRFLMEILIHAELAPIFTLFEFKFLKKKEAFILRLDLVYTEARR